MMTARDDAQVSCFINAAEHLEDVGCFVVEVGVPALRLLPPGQQAVPFMVENDQWAYDIYDRTPFTHESTRHVSVWRKANSRPDAEQT